MGPFNTGIFGNKIYQPRHAGWCRGKLKPETRCIPPCHNRRARRGANRIPRVAVHERHTFFGNPVNMRRLHIGARRTATIEADIVETHIIGQNKNDIRWSLVCEDNSRVRPTSPCHLLMRANRIL